MSYFLKVLSSPGNKLDGVKLELPEGECLVGRASPPAQVQLDGSKVSKKHCVFKTTSTRLEVEDLKSSNGLFVNGKRVDRAELNERDRLVIGEFVIEIVRGAPLGAGKGESKE